MAPILSHDDGVHRIPLDRGCLDDREDSSGPDVSRIGEPFIDVKEKPEGRLKSSSSVVTMMQATDPPMRNDATWTYGGDSPGRRSLPQSEMRSILVVVTDILREQPLQVPFVHGNHVIQQISTTALYPALSNAILPGALKGSPQGSDSQRSNCGGNLEPVLPIAIKQEEAGSRTEGKRLAELLHNPKARGVFRHIEVQDSASIMGNDKETIDDPKGDGRDREKVHRRNRFPMIPQKSEPALGRLRVPGGAFHPAGDRRFRDAIVCAHDAVAKGSTGKVVLNFHGRQFSSIHHRRRDWMESQTIEGVHRVT
jgi:hypothetical protein